MWRDFLINIKPLKPQRSRLRNNATPTEKILWLKLRRKQFGFWFKRQVSIGPYVVDFYCPQKHLAIELDGSSHQTIDQKEYDHHRTRYLNALNIRVVRFWNSEIERNLDKVARKIYSTLHSSPNLGEETKKEEYFKLVENVKNC